jgi:hypothetical protein
MAVTWGVFPGKEVTPAPPSNHTALSLCVVRLWSALVVGACMRVCPRARRQWPFNRTTAVLRTDGGEL